MMMMMMMTTVPLWHLFFQCGQQKLLTAASVGRISYSQYGDERAVEFAGRAFQQNSRGSTYTDRKRFKNCHLSVGNRNVGAACHFCQSMSDFILVFYSDLRSM